MTKKELLEKIKALGDISKEQRNSIVCALIGHSRIQNLSWGYYSCSRCNAQLGDSLASIYDDEDVFIVGHNCKKCRKNKKTLTWKDKIYVPEKKYKD